MVLGDPTTCIYQFIYDENDSNNTNIIQCFIMHGLLLCIKLNSCAEHMLYAWSLEHNKTLPIAIKQNKYFIPLNSYSNVFDWKDGNSNKKEHGDKNHLYDRNKIQTVIWNPKSHHCSRK